MQPFESAILLALNVSNNPRVAYDTIAMYFVCKCILNIPKILVITDDINRCEDIFTMQVEILLANPDNKFELPNSIDYVMKFCGIESLNPLLLEGDVLFFITGNELLPLNNLLDPSENNLGLTTNRGIIKTSDLYSLIQETPGNNLLITLNEGSKGLLTLPYLLEETAGKVSKTNSKLYIGNWLLFFGCTENGAISHSNSPFGFCSKMISSFIQYAISDSKLPIEYLVKKMQYACRVSFSNKEMVPSVIREDDCVTFIWFDETSDEF